MVKVAPSILSCDFASLGAEALAIKNAGGEYLHVDVMDGHFVPNISLGVPVVASLRKATDLILDVHLMMTHPIDYVEAFAKAGSDIITFHIESDSPAEDTIHRIHSFGKKAGISVSPNTSVDCILPYLHQIDLVLIMTVHPGFGGQSFMSEMMHKIEVVSAYKKEHNLCFIVEVDGGISSKTAATATNSGAELLVAGSAVFGQADYKQAMQAILNTTSQSSTYTL